MELVKHKDKLKMVNISDITVDSRYREDLGDIEGLMASIAEKGVIQPITLSSDLKLLAGCRRYTSSKNLGLKQIPALIRDIEGEVDEREIELFENIHRKSFTWQEEANLVAEIDRLYKSKNPEWSGRKTAELLDKGKSNVNRSLKLASAIEAIPELKECKTADEALKSIQKLEREAIVQELSRRQAASVSNTSLPASQGGMDAGVRSALKVADANYVICDVFKGLAGMRDHSNIDFIECDPPYGIDLNEQKAGDSAASYKEVSRMEYPAFLKKLANELYRVAGKDCWMVFWFGPTWHSEVLGSLREAGWLVDDIPAIWNKGTGQTKQPEIHLARAYEPFFVCRKGSPVMNRRGTGNVFTRSPCPTSGDDAKYHPTQRPISLIQGILQTFLAGAGHVLVPFAGSGATLRTCYKEGHQVLGFDLDDQYKPKFLLKVEEDTRELMKKEAKQK